MSTITGDCDCGADENTRHDDECPAVAASTESSCCREPLDDRGACSGCGASAKVRALIYGGTSIDASWTEADYLQLALAALDQAGVSVTLQRRVNEWVDDEIAERDVCAVNRAWAEDE